MKDSTRSSGAMLTLVIAVLLVVGSTAQIMYRFTLPTDGWSVYTEDVDNANWVYWKNMAGAPSGLQQGDQILSVDGVDVSGTASTDFQTAPAHWQAGQQVSMVVLRDGEEITVDVPVVHWTWAALWRNNVTEISKVISILGGLVLAFIGFFTFSQRPDLPSARALMMLCAAMTASSISGLLPDGLSMGFDPAAYGLTAFFSYAIFGIVIAPSLLTFSLHFPHTKSIITRHRWLGYIPAGIGFVIFLSVAVIRAAAALAWLGTAAMFISSAISLVHSAITQRDAVSRAQMRWAGGGFVLGILLFLMVFPSAFGWITDDFWASVLGSGASVGFTVIGVTLAIAVLRYRLFDIDLIIRRTLTYALVTTLLAIMYFGGVVVLQSVFEGVMGEQSPLAIVASTLLIAALFAPLRRRVQDFVDRRFDRRKYDAARTLDAFATTLYNEVDIERLEQSLIGIVDTTMKPDSISLWVQDPSRPERSIPFETGS